MSKAKENIEQAHEHILAALDCLQEVGDEAWKVLDDHSKTDPLYTENLVRLSLRLTAKITTSAPTVPR